VYKSPGRTWSDADISELLKLGHKCILAGDLNAKHPSWNSAVSNPSGEKLLQLFDASAFEISAPEYPTHYSPVGNGDVLDIVVHKNIRISNVTVSDILDSDHIPIIFHILDQVRKQNASAPLEKFTD
jgi:endonuclease/exonuclease/phosphatase family metal-dependent hydrolase